MRSKVFLVVISQLLLINYIHASEPVIADDIKRLTSLTIWTPTNYQIPFKLVCEGISETPWFGVYWLIDGRFSEQYEQLSEKFTSIKQKDTYYVQRSSLSIYNWDMYKDHNLSCIMTNASTGTLKRSTKLSLLEECMSVNNH
ncbi:IL-18 binding protein [Hypsugopox virus]|nr:IL-18 binding protein [Hypsugopox virus]